MQLAQLVETSAAVAGTRARLEKTGRLADCLRRLEGAEIGIGVDYLSGELPQGRIGLGPATLARVARTVTPAGKPGTGPSLSEVDRAFAGIAKVSGEGAQSTRRRLLGELLGRTGAPERDFLMRLILGELRQGALEGLLVEALAKASAIDAARIRRAVMLAGRVAPVAEAALRHGSAGLDRFRLAVMSPVKPMLAQPAENIASALGSLGKAALEYKVDGARVQIHKQGPDVRVFSRGLHDVSPRVPEIVEAVRTFPGRELILDGEVVALTSGGRPQPFQVTMRRFGRKLDVEPMRRGLPLGMFLFDCLHVNGEDLIDLALEERFTQLGRATRNDALVPHLTTDRAGEANDFLRSALAGGHEGIMAKAPGAPYAAGNRGADWLKVKPVHTLDLVVLAAEWGSGRRSGYLSNLHLGARDPDNGGFVMLGKTFKGLTDAMLDWQTRRLLALEIGREGPVVHVRPELVVEIAVNEIQTSPQYPAGMALRFARVKRYRDDKTADAADTVATVAGLHTGGG